MNRSILHRALLVAGVLAAAPVAAQTTGYALLSADGALAFAIDGRAPDASAARAITGLATGEELVAIDVRAQNGRLYALAHDPKAGRVRLYHVDLGGPGARATPLGAPSTFTDGAGNPVPIFAAAFDIDFNPTVDRLRVIASNGLNFRMNPPHDGALVDGDFGNPTAPSPGVNPDANLAGGAGGAMGTAYTNNAINATLTTQYTLDHRDDRLYIQNPPNAGTLVQPLPVTLGGQPLDFGAVGGIDIQPGIVAAASGGPATGLAVAALTVGGTSRLYRIDLATGAAIAQGALGGLSVVDLAVLALPPAANALSTDGTRLFRFPLATPMATAAATVTGVVAGERLVGIDQRPTTAQLYALGIDAASDRGTLYRLEPQSAGGTARAVPVGTPGGIAWVDAGGAPVDLSDLPAGFDFNPAADRIRLVDASGLNARIQPDTGAAIDGDAAAAGTNPDGAIQAPIGTQLVGTAYTSNYAAPVATTQYTLDQFGAQLYIQNPPNGGVQTLPLALAIGGAPFAFRGDTGFDIPPGPTSATASATTAGLGYFTADDPSGAATLYEIELADASVRALGAIGSGGRPLTGLAAYDAPRAVAFEASALGVDESNTPASIAVILLDGASAPVHYRTLDGSATAGSDYTATSGTLFLTGPAPRAVFSVPIQVDTAAEPDEQFTVRLEGPFAAPVDLVVTIRDRGDAIFQNGFEPL
ncbi:MAG: DUF4394 domain-containing protein [Xanthomonadaceae bacterium]|jgi:hypothetical protein|nr:DUF4394 domain-containing protein [Xanthomonadaceae bacterium]